MPLGGSGTWAEAVVNLLTDQGGSLQDALSEYSSYLVARMKDEMLQDPKHTVSQRELDGLTDQGVAQAYARYAAA